MDEVTPGPGNVTDIETARKPRDGKPKTVEVQLALVECLRRAPKWNRTNPLFFVRYETIEPAPGRRLVLRVDDDEQVVSVVPLDAVRMDLLFYIECHLSHRRNFLLTQSKAVETTKLWQDLSTPLPADEIKMTRWRSEEGLTFRRLPWNMEKGEAPTWDSILRRMTNAQAFMDWVGSLLVDDSSLHGYVWIYGPGGDGKGAMNRFLAKVFGQAYRSKQPPAKGDKFWTHGLLGARLVVFPDCDDAGFITSGLFKCLTGGDPVDVEAKGVMSFTTVLNAKYLVISNEKPTVSSEKSDLRRIIYCEMGVAPETDPGFEDRLWAEGGAFLTHCVTGYLAKYPDRRAIEADPDAIEGLVEENEQHFSDFFQEYFELDASSFCIPIQLRKAAKETFGNTGRAYRAFLRWLERRYGIRSVKKNIGGGKTENRFHGLSSKKLAYADVVLQDR